MNIYLYIKKQDNLMDLPMSESPPVVASVLQGLEVDGPDLAAREVLINLGVDLFMHAHHVVRRKKACVTFEPRLLRLNEVLYDILFLRFSQPS